jgi:hypothetical protein
MSSEDQHLLRLTESSGLRKYTVFAVTVLANLEVAQCILVRMKWILCTLHDNPWSPYLNVYE